MDSVQVFTSGDAQTADELKSALALESGTFAAAALDVDQVRNAVRGRVYTVQTDAYPALGQLLGAEPDLSDNAEKCLVAFLDQVYVDGVAVQSVYWDPSLCAVGWTASACKFPEGRLSFDPAYQQVIGTITTHDGDTLAVTGSELPQGADAVFDALARSHEPLPEYVNTASFDSSAPTWDHEAVQKVQGEDFETEVRGKADGDEWVPYKNLFHGAELDQILKTVVYIGLDDVSAGVAVIATSDDSLRIAKQPVPNPTNVGGSLSFDITISGVEEERSFIGTVTDDKGERLFRGKFRGVGTRVRAPGFAELGPDGKSLQELVAMSSLQRGAGPEKRASADLAQNEANRIFGRLLLGSVPQETQDKLYPNVIKLDVEERRIQSVGAEFFKHAGVHHLLRHLALSKDVKPELKSKVDVDVCGKFLSMCGSLVPPEKGEDPVQAYGWDREKDEKIIAQLQTQYRNVVLECYKLGYRRTVLAFQPFLAHAKYWYQRYANWVLSPAGTTELRNRILARAETGSTLYNIQVKLTLLKDAAGGDIGDAVDVKDALAELQGAAALPFLEQVEWNKETQDELLEIFRQIDLLEQHGGKEWQEHEAYHQHRELLEARGRTTWTDLLSETIAGLEKLRENKKWTMMEAANILALANDQLARARAREFRNVTRLDETLPFRVPPRMALPELAWRVAASHIRAAMMVVATSCMLRVLVDPETNKDLSTLEKVTMWGSIVDSFATLKDNYVLNLAGRGLAVVGRFFAGVANIVCRAVGRALTFIGAQWLVDSIRAAANWTANAVRRGVNWLKRGWEKVGDFAMKVFGFAMAICSVVSSAFDFESALKSGRLTDKVFTGINVVLAGLEVLCMTIHGIAWLAGATAVCNACSFLGPVLAATGVVVAIIAITVNYFLKDPDPVEHFITKYGQEYKLLVGMRKKA